MALQLGALRSALVEAGASEDKAARAAEELAGYENKFGSVDARFGAMDTRFERLEGKITLVQALLGILIAGVASLVLKAFV